MAEFGPDLLGGLPALQARVHRQKTEKQPQQLTLPELSVLVGRDKHGSGVTIGVWLPTGGDWPTYSRLYAARWRAPIFTAEEALSIAARSASAALAELFPPQTPA